MIREILDEHLLAQAGTAPGVADPFDQVIGIATGDGRAVAENVADYLYGNAPPEARAKARAKAKANAPHTGTTGKPRKARRT